MKESNVEKKREIIIFVVALTLIVCQALWISSHYTKSGIVWEVRGDLVIVKLADGEMYVYYTDTPPARFAKIDVVFDTNGTKNKYDDKVVRVK